MVFVGALYIAAAIATFISVVSPLGIVTPDAIAGFALLVIGLVLICGVYEKQYITSHLIVGFGLGIIIMLVYLVSFGASYLDAIILAEEFSPVAEDYNIVAIGLGILSLLGLWYYRPLSAQKEKSRNT